MIDPDPMTTITVTQHLPGVPGDIANDRARLYVFLRQQADSGRAMFVRDDRMDVLEDDEVPGVRHLKRVVITLLRYRDVDYLVDPFGKDVEVDAREGLMPESLRERLHYLGVGLSLILPNARARLRHFVKGR